MPGLRRFLVCYATPFGVMPPPPRRCAITVSHPVLGQCTPFIPAWHERNL